MAKIQRKPPNVRPTLTPAAEHRQLQRGSGNLGGFNVFGGSQRLLSMFGRLGNYNAGLSERR